MNEERERGQMHIEGLLIDKDDTLIRIEPFWKEPIHQLAVMTAEDIGDGQNIKLIYEFEKAAGFENGSLIQESIIVAGTNDDIFDKWKQVAVQNNVNSVIFESAQYRRLWLNRLSDLCRTHGKVEAYEELSSFFQEIKYMGITIGVVTSDSWDMTLHCLKKLGITRYIDEVYTADKYKAKPDPEVVSIFSKKYGTKRDNILMVGDSKNDMLFALNSGIHGIQIDYGNKRDVFDYAEKKIGSLKELCRTIV